MRRALRGWLETMFPKCEVIEATSGEQAITMAETGLPDVILMDVSLPGMNGLETTTRLKAIVPTTRSGFTATQVARFRPRPLILALSPVPATVRRLTLYWGCIPALVPDTKDVEDMIEKTADSALETGSVSKGDLIIITAGYPVWASGTTKMLKVKEL